MSESLFCPFCQREHSLTREYWYFRKDGGPPKCKKKVLSQVKMNSDTPEKKEAKRSYDKAYRSIKETERREYQRSYYSDNRQSLLQKDQHRRDSRSEAEKEDFREYQRRHHHKRKSDPNYRLRKNLRTRLRDAVKNEQKGGSAVRDLGCSIPELKSRLESLWWLGMSWDNYGFGKDKWHVDHIIPLSAFDLTNPEQVRAACHYSNLQPLWQPDNLRKSNKILQNPYLIRR